jgi:hypothetical protein
VIVAYGWLPTDNMLGWSLVLLVAATLLVLVVNQLLRGHFAYPAAVIWALAGMYVKQSGWDLPGAANIATLALVLIIIVVIQTVWLRVRAYRQPRAIAAAHRHRR